MMWLRSAEFWQTMNILQDITQSEERKRRIREEAAEERRRQESDVPPPKKAKVTMSVLCVENGVLGGVRKEAEVRSRCIWLNLLLAFSGEYGNWCTWGMGCRWHEDIGGKIVKCTCVYLSMWGYIWERYMRDISGIHMYLQRLKKIRKFNAAMKIANDKVKQILVSTWVSVG